MSLNIWQWAFQGLHVSAITSAYNSINRKT